MQYRRRTRARAFPAKTPQRKDPPRRVKNIIAQLGSSVNVSPDFQHTLYQKTKQAVSFCKNHLTNRFRCDKMTFAFGTANRGVAQLGSALGSGPRGRWFESSHSDDGSNTEKVL